MMDARRMEPDEFAAIVAQVLASMPAIRIAPSDVDAAAADLVRRVLTAYPRPRQRGLFGLRAILDEHGPDSYMVRHARFLIKLDQFGWRYRGL